MLEELCSLIGCTDFWENTILYNNAMQNTNDEQQLFNSNELQETDPFEEGKRKLGTYKFISVIGLCEHGDVWFAKRIVLIFERLHHV